jgi:hypothetical protein
MLAVTYSTCSKYIRREGSTLKIETGKKEIHEDTFVNSKQQEKLDS